MLGVAHPDANIIFGTVVDESMGDTVRVTVIAAGFDRWDGTSRPQTSVLEATFRMSLVKKKRYKKKWVT